MIVSGIPNLTEANARSRISSWGGLAQAIHPG